MYGLVMISVTYDLIDRTYVILPRTCKMKQFQLAAIRFRNLDMLVHVVNIYVWFTKCSSVFIVNIALNKPTYQEYRFTGLSKNLTQASNAVDGLKSNLSVWEGQCVISDINQQTATWWVNLTSILSIQHITIYYRTDNANWGRGSIIFNYHII